MYKMTQFCKTYFFPVTLGGAKREEKKEGGKRRERGVCVGGAFE